MSSGCFTPQICWEKCRNCCPTAGKRCPVHSHGLCSKHPQRQTWFQHLLLSEPWQMLLQTCSKCRVTSEREDLLLWTQTRQHFIILEPHTLGWVSCEVLISNLWAARDLQVSSALPSPLQVSGLDSPEVSPQAGVPLLPSETP